MSQEINHIAAKLFEAAGQSEDEVIELLRLEYDVVPAESVLGGIGIEFLHFYLFMTYIQMSAGIQEEGPNKTSVVTAKITEITTKCHLIFLHRPNKPEAEMQRDMEAVTERLRQTWKHYLNFASARPKARDSFEGTLWDGLALQLEALLEAGSKSVTTSPRYANGRLAGFPMCLMGLTSKQHAFLKEVVGSGALDPCSPIVS